MNAKPLDRAAFADGFSSALRRYVELGGESALTEGYELGRRAVGGGMSLLDVAMIHHEAFLRTTPPGNRGETELSRAAQFLAEALSPFEMTLRTYQGSVRLLGLADSLARENAALERARNQLGEILDATTALIYMKDAEGRYVFANRRFLALFDVPRDRVVARLDRDFLPEDAAATFSEADASVVRAGTSQEAEHLIGQGADARVFLASRVALLDDEGACYAVCCVATDITERKRAADALHRAKLEVEAANRELEAFSYSVAHDLRAPLRSVIGFGEALIEECAPQLDVEGRRYLARIQDSAARMGRLIDALLGLARVTRRRPRRAEVDLAAVARRVVERLRGAAPDRVVEFVAPPLALARGDEQLLESVLENLLGNAWKFTVRRERARVEFGVEEVSGRRAYFVRDDGAGFDPTQASRLFGVFQRLHPEREFEGTGIGLATVERIVRRHGGEVWAVGAVDAGATFYFTLGDDESRG